MSKAPQRWSPERDLILQNEVDVLVAGRKGYHQLQVLTASMLTGGMAQRTAAQSEIGMLLHRKPTAEPMKIVESVFTMVLSQGLKKVGPNIGLES